MEIIWRQAKLFIVSLQYSEMFLIFEAEIKHKGSQ